MKEIKNLIDMRKRKIVIFTGNRAEYGLQFPIIEAINNHKNLDLSIFVSGAHLDSNFGTTLNEINNDGFKIGAKIKIKMDSKSIFSNSQAIGNGIVMISKALKKIKPDFFMVYADRFEGFAAVIASTQMNIPTAHIEGGDLTEGGSLDDSVRHAMTKLSHIHFTTNKQASKRIIGMGEEAWRVHTVGFPAIDLISKSKYSSEQEVLKKLSLNLDQPIIIFTQHSITTELKNIEKQINPSLSALEVFAKKGFQIIITYPNNDSGGNQIISKINNLKRKKIKNIKIYKSLGRSIYHGLLALNINNRAKIVCVGNSSSGIKETPAFFCPTVNIGSRQKGRLRANNIIDTNYNKDEIIKAINKCLYNQKFRKICKKTKNPYYIGGAGKKIANVLNNINIDKKLIQKKMMLKGDLKNGWHR